MSPLIVCVVNSHGSDVFRSCSASGHTHAPKLPGSARDINCSRLDKHNSICSGIPGQTRSLGRSTRWWLPVRTAAAEEMRLIARHFLPGLEPVAEFTPRSHAIFRLCVVLQSQEIWMLILFLRRGRPSRCLVSPGPNKDLFRQSNSISTATSSRDLAEEKRSGKYQSWRERCVQFALLKVWTERPETRRWKVRGKT